MVIGRDIRRSEFLRLTALLAMASCEPGKSEPQVVHAPILPPVETAAPTAPTADHPVAPPPRSTSAPVATTDDKEGPDPPSDPSCSNAKGSLAVCKRIGPACEGLVDECTG